MSFLDILILTTSVVLFQNIIFNNFLGVCTFFTDIYRDRPFYSLYFGTAFVLTTNSVVSFLIYDKILVPNKLQYLFIIVFAMLSFIFIQVTELVSKKFALFIHTRLSSFLPLAVTNCLLFGVSILIIIKNFTLKEVFFFCILASFSYTFTLYTVAFILEKIENNDTVEYAKGVPIGFAILAIMSLTFSGLYI